MHKESQTRHKSNNREMREGERERERVCVIPKVGENGKMRKTKNGVNEEGAQVLQKQIWNANPRMCAFFYIVLYVTQRKREKEAPPTETRKRGRLKCAQRE